MEIKIENYKTYLMVRKLKDSKETYRAYCDEFEFDDLHIKHEKMKKQYVDATYHYRFTNFDWE